MGLDSPNRQIRPTRMLIGVVQPGLPLVLDLMLTGGSSSLTEECPVSLLAPLPALGLVAARRYCCLA